MRQQNFSQNNYAVVLEKRPRKQTAVFRVQPMRHVVAYEHPPPPRDPPPERSPVIRKKKATTPAWVAMLLVCFMVFQPVYVAFGMELESDEPIVEVVEADEIPHEKMEEEIESADEVVEEIEEETEVDEEIGDSESVDLVEDSEEVDEDEETQEASSEDEEVGTSTPDTSLPDAIDDFSASSSESVEEDELEEENDSSSSGSGGSSSSENDSQAASSTETVASSTTNAASSTQTTSSGSSSTSDTQSDAASAATSSAASTTPATTTETFMLGDHECMTLDDGALYCIKPGEAVTDDPNDIGYGNVVARVDAQGDREIYLVESGKTVQITRNDYDDFAPVYDEVTHRIAWHAMIDDRLQIMIHDRTTGETRQITSTTYNNSNPHVFGDVVVWQAWIKDNWEIFQARNLHRDVPDIEQLTHNSRHDMFPRVFDSYITWQAQTNDSWHVVVYDQETNRYSYVKKQGEGRYENPRFALLFDNRSEDGEVQVVGYDVATDEPIPLAPVERKIPEPVVPTEDTGDAALPAVSASTSIKTGERRDGEDI